MSAFAQTSPPPRVLPTEAHSNKRPHAEDQIEQRPPTLPDSLYTMLRRAIQDTPLPLADLDAQMGGNPVVAEEGLEQMSPPKKKRGRPPKNKPAGDSGVAANHHLVAVPTPHRSEDTTDAVSKRKETILDHTDLAQEPSPGQETLEQAALPKKKRGRPPKNKSTSGLESDHQRIVLATPTRPRDVIKPVSKRKEVVLGLPPDSSPPTSRKLLTKSSTIKPSADVVKKEQLAYMTPSVTFLKSEAFRSPSLPAKTRQLWSDRISPALSQRQFIPHFFKDRISAISKVPVSYRPEIPADYFGSQLESHPEEYEWIWRTVVDIESMAEEYRHTSTESHWNSVVIQPLLHLVRRLRKPYAGDNSQLPLLEVVDIATTEISPPSLCPYFENSAALRDSDKQIDCAVGLRLSKAERFTLQRGQYSEGSEPSINQTSSFVNMTPMFINIKVKRFHSAEDPMIPLAAWIAAEFKKRLTEGYSLDMPVLAITVDGDLWQLYIASATPTESSERFRCHFIGPFEMGATTDLIGIFKILNCLWSFTSWGLKEYRSWFEEEILAKYR